MKYFVNISKMDQSQMLVGGKEGGEREMKNFANMFIMDRERGSGVRGEREK